MNFFIFLVLIIGYFFSLGSSIFTSYYVIRHHEKYRTKLMSTLILLTVNNFGIISYTLFILSAVFYISDLINLLLWKILIISYFILLIKISVIYNFMRDYKNIPILPYLWFIILLGLLVGNIMSQDSIKISITNDNTVNYSFNLLFKIHFIIFQISMIIYYLYINIMTFKESRKKK